MKPIPHQLTAREPLWIFAILWPLVFLAPLVPRLPQSSIVAFPWRQELAVALLLIITFARRLGHTRESNCSGCFRRNELLFFLPLAGFVCWGVASMLWARGWFHVAYYNLSWIAYFICFFLMRWISDRPRLMTLSLAVLAVVISIISISATIEFWSTEPDFYQFGLLLRRSTGLGEPLAVSVPIFAILAVTLRKGRAALLCGVATVLAWSATLQSLERAPIVGLAAGLLLLVMGMVFRRVWRPRQPIRAVLLVVALVIAAAAQSLTTSSLTRFHESKGTDASTQVRFLVWAVGLEMLRLHPLQGVGANNYELAYPEARAQFAARQPNSPLVGSEEELLAQRAHNEYIQILAELGLIGFALFLLFCAGLIWVAFKALSSARNPLALGAVCSLMTFAVSSGASSVSFRWFGSGLLFFWAAAITMRFAPIQAEQHRHLALGPVFVRKAAPAALVLVLVFLASAGALGINSTLRGLALTETPFNGSDDSSESLFRKALYSNPYDGPTHFEFGGWLYDKRRYKEALPHLRLATERGLNSSTCYALLAGAEAAAGEANAAEQTLSKAVTIYPRSVFLHVRHAIALAEAGKSHEASRAYETALTLDAPAARGWRQLMCFGPSSARVAASQDSSISPPKDLQPASWAYAAIAEHAIRPPIAYPADSKLTAVKQ